MPFVPVYLLAIFGVCISAQWEWHWQWLQQPQQHWERPPKMHWLQLPQWESQRLSQWQRPRQQHRLPLSQWQQPQQEHKPFVPKIDQSSMECICQQPQHLMKTSNIFRLQYNVASKDKQKKYKKSKNKCHIPKASSSCNLTIGCKSKGADDYFCGPYWISWAYWYDGGRHGNTGKPEDFQNCLIDKECAEKTVRGFMRRYGRDCDDNGTVDCADFARIHKLGFKQCSRDSILDTGYWQRFELCNKNDQSNDEIESGKENVTLKYRDRVKERRDGVHPDYQNEDPITFDAGYQAVVPDAISGLNTAER
ncbi:uncharacterized protein NPIL_499381 [Nephila pilipes]|uniref:lysozyme n=1 Tax=Nephila pilipes TaxID=299642 RepID=A0A8X6UE66_NEPPI|nr:uncharacterized protein NPIL_499381 [Nephila pilipes]